MGIRKKVTDELVVGGSPSENLGKAKEALDAAGFKKVVVDQGLQRVSGNWKPLIGTLYGDITVTLVAQGSNTQVQLTSLANVDNAYALLQSPGARIIEKFLNEFSPRVSPASGDVGPVDSTTEDVSEKLQNLIVMKEAGHLSDDEFTAAKRALLGSN